MHALKTKYKYMKIQPNVIHSVQFHKVFFVVLVKSESFYYPYCDSHVFKCYHGQFNLKLSQSDLTIFFN